MKKSIVNLLIVAAVITSVTSGAIGSPKHFGLSGSEVVMFCDLQQKKDSVSQKEVYTCPMHPEVMQDTPGKCPKCKMNLVKKEIAKAVYTCPMHPEVIQDKAGKCPKCKMNLVRKEIAKAVYTCPMHPEVIQDTPGKCTKCKMNLVKKEIAKK